MAFSSCPPQDETDESELEEEDDATKSRKEDLRRIASLEKQNKELQTALEESRQEVGPHVAPRNGHGHDACVLLC